MRNVYAKEVRTPKYRMRIVAAKRGRGSFKRKSKHQDDFSVDIRSECGMMYSR